MKKCNFGHFKEQCDLHPKGSSSFNMHDEQLLLQEFSVAPGEVVLDLGCGPGDYAMRLSPVVGERGKIIAIDRNQEVTDYLEQRVANSGITNIETIVANIKQGLPLKSGSVDLCLVVTVLHTVNIMSYGEQIFREIKRVLKPNGRLITIDVKKEEFDFGPPLHMKIAPDELALQALKAGLIKDKTVDLTYNYLLRFHPKARE